MGGGEGKREEGVPYIILILRKLHLLLFPSPPAPINPLSLFTPHPMPPLSLFPPYPMTPLPLFPPHPTASIMLLKADNTALSTTIGEQNDTIKLHCEELTAIRATVASLNATNDDPQVAIVTSNDEQVAIATSNDEQGASVVLSLLWCCRCCAAVVAVLLS